MCGLSVAHVIVGLTELGIAWAMQQVHALCSSSKGRMHNSDEEDPVELRANLVI